MHPHVDGQDTVCPNGYGSIKTQISVGNSGLALSLWSMLSTSQRELCSPSGIVDSSRTGNFVHLFLVQNAFLFLTHPISEGVDPMCNSDQGWSYRYVIIMSAFYATTHQIERTWHFLIIRPNTLQSFQIERKLGLHPNMWPVLQVIWLPCHWLGSASLGDLAFSLSQLVLEFSQKQIGGESMIITLSIAVSLELLTVTFETELKVCSP